MPDSRTTCYLIKFFEHEEYANQFISGNLYLNRLSYFKGIEEIDDGRGDKKEAIATWLQPHNLTIQVPSFPELDIHPEDFAGPVSISFDTHNDLHIFCLYAVHSGRFQCVNGIIDYAENEIDELNEQLKIHEDCFKFGEYAVIVKAKDFCDRVAIKIRNMQYSANMKLVDYYDPKSFHGNFPFNEIPFRKQDKYSYQNEFRIAIGTRTAGNDPLRLEIGSIDDIAKKFDAKSLNGLIVIKPA